MHIQAVRFVGVAALLTIAVCSLASRAVAAAEQPKVQGEHSWHSLSLTMETVTAPNGAVTTATQLEANAL